MNDEPRGNEPSFSGLRVPEPPEELRRQVLCRAGQALEDKPRRDPWARIWESGPARLAWAASVLALAICHLLVPTDDPGTAIGPSSFARNGSGDQEELAAIADLPRLSLEARSIVAATHLTGEIETELEVAAPEAASEENPS